MKKSVLLLSLSALFSIGALTSCNGKNNDSSSQSSEVDPEANWPVHEWSSEEKATAEARFGFDILAKLPFYYIEGLQLNNYASVMSFEAENKGSAADVTAYGRKLNAAGFELYDVDYNMYRLALGKVGHRYQYIVVRPNMYNGTDFNIDFAYGELIEDFSFSGLNAQEGQLCQDVSEAIADYFDAYDIENPLVLPDAFPTGNTIKQMDFVDYTALAASFFEDASGNHSIWWDYANIVEDLGSSFDFNAPHAEIMYTSDAKANLRLNQEKNRIINSFVEIGYEKIDSVDSEGNAYSVYRNDSGFEVEFATIPYDDGTGEDLGHPAYVTAFITHEEFHDYSHYFFSAEMGEDKAMPFRYVNTYFGLTYGDLCAFTQTTGENFAFGVTDLRPSNFKEYGVDLGPYLSLSVLDFFLSEENVTTVFTEQWLWTAVAETELLPAHFEKEIGDYTYCAILDGFEEATESDPSYAVIEVLRLPSND